MKKLHVELGIAVVSSVLALAACGGSQQSAEPPATPEPAPPEAALGPEPLKEEQAPAEAPAAEAAPAAPRTIEVPLRAKSNSKLTGTATLTETPDGVRVVLVVENVTPGDHGAHVHEKGDCSAADGSSAGSHYNPTAHPHALPATSPRHLGDLGNITVGKDGKGTLEIVAPGATLKDPSDPSSFVGKAIIVHEKKDDGGQPVGNAGGRIGCAEIK